MEGKRCGACTFSGKECPPDCPFAPYFPSDQPEKYEEVLQLKQLIQTTQQELAVLRSRIGQLNVRSEEDDQQNVDVVETSSDNDEDDSESSENGEEVFEEAKKAVDELYNTRDTYYPTTAGLRSSKLVVDSNLALKLLNEIPAEKRKTKYQRATYEYLKGKVLDVFPDYTKEAEEHLSKAVKLNPSLADAWLCLGNCIWKKDELVLAKNCFKHGLSKGPHKGLLCQLSMLERKMAEGAEDKVKLVAESIKHAKEALALDVKDGNSWYNLGNAYLTSFFVTGAWDHETLMQSLKGYQLAEKDERMTSNPDLHYNSATVHKYLENYERALNGFEAAALKDPSLNAAEEVQKIVRLLDKIEGLIRGQKAKRLSSLAASLASVNLNPLYRRETIDRLQGGLNRGVAVVGKVMFFVKHDSGTPFYYLLCGSSQICYIMSVYGIKNEAIKEGDQVTVLEPSYRYVDFSWKGKLYQFRSVRVEFVEQVLVNGKTLPNHYAVRTSIVAQNKT